MAPMVFDPAATEPPARAAPRAGIRLFQSLRQALKQAVKQALWDIIKSDGSMPLGGGACRVRLFSRSA
ncbi:hypothetical protein CBM2623_A150041 [Cupriavidus taiwanensis]|nr:hypothetical protein CBM2608_A150041 [Cupriavidus taiwanensis]SPA25788.1 hypothetical protein CBM2623_A150041 [Cupriavidus taiwanensis]